LTPSDFRAAGWTPSDLEEYQKEWDSIPIIPMLYTKLLHAIEAKERIHNQSTYGPDCDPETNLCKTPMCTAGHLVNMADGVGYKLRQKYGFPIAARLIHLKNRPDVQPQNFGNIRQELAMAYIRERAAEEAAMEKKTKTKKKSK
jgi:hypothetical protein